MPRERNYVARSPLMRKGGPHIKSKTGKRVRERLEVDDALYEWLYENEADINAEENENGEPGAPHFLLDFMLIRSNVFRHVSMNQFEHYNKTALNPVW